MKTLRSILSIVVLSLLFSININSQSIIINELYNSSGNDEWLELLVVQDSLDIRNYDIRDFSSSGVAQQPLVFSNNALWSNLKTGTIIIIARSENIFAEDLDPGDYLLVVKSNNAQYLTGNPFLFAGGSEAVQIRNSSQSHIFGVSWGSANSGSIPDPKVHFSTSSSSGTAIYFNEDSLPEITTVANWTTNGTPTMGAGNTANNINWILSLRARPEGSGIIALSPQVAPGDSLITLTFNYKKDPQYNINVLKIIFPEGFTWSQSTAQIAIENFTASISIMNDTILFSNVSFTDDSVLISIDEVLTPLFTGLYRFKFQSGIDLLIGDVSPTPVITIFGAPVPIVEIK
jgi:hypothetical protein